ncbi:MAG TPA: tetratricopeptide repeat protein [Thermoanaerobaculia bacterium]|jgi:tetratricopeptide (TPR) repeat protein|nr:tetratricopeptide repeat protein [Thermoanaerobaculia bacterium]
MVRRAHLGTVSAVLALLATAAVAAPVPAPTPESQPTPAESFAVGRMLELEGDFAGALDHLHRVVEASPRDPYARLELAGLALRMGRGDEAARQARQAISLAPADPDVLHDAAQALLALAGENPAVLAEARDALEKLLLLRPEDPDALQTLSRIYLNAGDSRRAEEMLRRLASAVPDAKPVANQLLHLLLQRGAKADAAALMREQLDRDPEAIEQRLGLADLLSDIGDHAGAVAVLRAAPGEQAKQSDVLRRLAFELYRTGDSAGAKALVDAQLAAGPDPRLRLFRALLLEEQGKDEEALHELETLHGELPSDPEVGLALARMLARGDKRDDAQRLLQELIGMAESAGGERRNVADRARLELAQLFAQEERWDDVLAQLDQLKGSTDGTGAGGTGAAATLLRADALVAQGHKEEALAQLVPSSGLPPAALAAKRAELLLGMDREQEAAAELAKLPAGLEGKGQAAEVYQRAGRNAEAIPLLVELLAADPSSVELRFRLGAAYERSGREAEATETFRELLRRAPDNSMALNYLGYMWAEKGENLPEALGMIRRALEIDPENAAYIDSLGWVYFRLGDFPHAVEQLEKAARMLPGDGTVQEHLGDALRAAGKGAEARTAYQRALQLGDTDSAQVRRKLDEIERDLPRN